MIYVQHLLGTGHIKRSLILARAIRDSGCRVQLVSGGPETPETRLDPDLAQLPPVRAKDQSFRELIDDQGQPIDSEWETNRRNLLLEHYQRLRPDVVIIESYPFGRRKLRFELTPLLKTIQRTTPKPLVVCSVRDIVQRRSADRDRETVEVLREHFDLVMVHGDPRLVGFEESFQALTDIENLVRYTGYVTGESSDGNGDAGSNEVIVAAGGGAVGSDLFMAALKARASSQASGLRWRVLVGHNVSEQDLAALRSQTTGDWVIERNRDDYRTLLKNCAVSVSQAGYNTVTDILRCGARAVLVPFEGEGETEQRLRATKLQQRGLAVMLTEAQLSPRALAHAVDESLAGVRPESNSFDLDGARGASRLIMAAWHEIN